MTMSRLMLSETLRKLGTGGVIGVALLAFSLSLGLSTLLPSWQERDRRRASAAASEENQSKAAARASLQDDTPAGRLKAFYAIFPLQAGAPEMLSRVYAAAEEKNLQLSRGEYAFSTDPQTGLAVYRMTLPVSGGYTQIREFLAAALKAVPTLALDELSFERPKISDTQVQARIRLTLYLKFAS